jgi:pimeloyl-ACP methyl ester carboxylesterase
MPAFFIHGVPDTSELWNGVRSHLKRDDVVALNMPGFNAPVPDGFDASMQSYADWLIARIEELGEPVDIVGHDWGSILTQRTVSARPDLVRTWTAGGGPMDPEYVWHDMAKAWQTPNVGEQVMQAFTPDAITGAFTQQGIEEATARQVGLRIDDTMKDCILRLYRSATNVSNDWPALDNKELPGLVLWGADDPYCPVPFAQRLGDRTGAKVVVFENCSHWWPHQRPKEVAALLEELWATA